MCLHLFSYIDLCEIKCTDIQAVTVSDVMFAMRTDLIFDLTCISTGGPATTVTWTRDSVTVTEGTVTHYNTFTHMYANTLTVTGRLPGLYTCTVANCRPSIGSASITVQGIKEACLIVL